MHRPKRDSIALAHQRIAGDVAGTSEAQRADILAREDSLALARERLGLASPLDESDECASPVPNERVLARHDSLTLTRHRLHGEAKPGKAKLPDEAKPTSPHGSMRRSSLAIARVRLNRGCDGDVREGDGVLEVDETPSERVLRRKGSLAVTRQRQGRRRARKAAAQAPSAAGAFAQLLIDAAASGTRPAVSKEVMYECFLADIATGADALSVPPRAADVALRLLTFNVHFFQRGFSGEEHGPNRAAISDAVRATSPDVVLLQEVVSDGASITCDEQLLSVLDPALGYTHVTFAPASDCHVLHESVRSAPGARCAVAILSRLPLISASAVPLGGDSHGSAASAVVALPRAGDASVGAPLQVGLYTVHLSVRCPLGTRLAEMSGVVAHADAAIAAARCDECIVAGDFNQPCERDYAADVWAAMARDMDGAGLPRCDGVAPALRDGTAGAAQWTTSFDDAGVATPPVSAWNGATVDFVYRRKRRDGERAAERGALRAVGSWIHFTSASDHLPIIADYAYA